MMRVRHSIRFLAPFGVLTPLVVGALILSGNALLGGSTPAKAAGPFTIVMSSFPGEPASGVVGTTTFLDYGPSPIVLGAASATGINPAVAFYPSIAVEYYTGKNCDPATLVAILVYRPGAANQQLFLTDGVPLGVLLTQPADPAVLLRIDGSAPYLGGASSIQSAGLSDLTGYNPANQPPNRNVDIQYLACGNLDASAVISPFGGHLRDQPPLSQLDTLPPIPGDVNGDTVVNTGDITLAIDADATNGNGPCDPVDQAADVTGGAHEVAVCLAHAAPVAAFDFELVYDDTLNKAPEIDCVGPKCLDDNPDANAGATLGSGLPTTPNLGGGWDCSAGGAAPPMGDADPETGPGHGVARLICYTTDTPTSPENSSYWPLAAVTFNVLASGTDTLTLRNVDISDMNGTALGRCNYGGGEPEIPCYGASNVKTFATPTPTGTPTITPTPTPTYTPTITPTPGPALSIDMDMSAPGIQDSLGLGGSGNFQVGVVIQHPGRPVAGFQFDLVYDNALLHGIEVADEGAALDDNPDANAGTTTWPTSQGDDLGEGWDCSLTGEHYPVAGGGRASIVCMSASGPHTLGDDESEGILAVVTLQPAGLTENDTWLSLENVLIVDGSSEEIGSCNPVINSGMSCVGGSVKALDDGDGIPGSADNCPFVPNPDQLNSDAKPIDITPVPPGTDHSVPNSDILGDACDLDIDNDYMLNTGTNQTLGIPGEDVGCGSGPTNPKLMDSDGDTVVDGYECLAGTDPKNPLSKPSLNLTDSDRDGLPDSVEALFGCDPNKADTDGDGISDGFEVKGWATSCTLKDTNVNGCPDNVEIADVNGDYRVNVADHLIVAKTAIGWFAYNADVDVTKDGRINVADQLLVAKQQGKSCTRP
jgi:hypothetical protein